MSINDNITGFAPAGQITPDPENTIDAPNTLTPDASTPIGTPDTVTPVGAGSITAPNTINPDAVNAVDAPNTLTPDAVNNVDTPNTLAPDAVNPIATPVGLAPLNSEPINRVLTPLIGLNFSSQNYSVMGQPSTFENALTYSRASSATYVETYVDALNRKQKRIATVGANVPRLEDAGLLVEGASTNLALRSEELDNPVWSLAGSGGGVAPVVIPNASKAPDETMTADRITLGILADSLSQRSIVRQLIQPSGVYTMSFYIRQTGGTATSLKFHEAGGAVGNIELSGEWQRFSYSGNQTLNSFFGFELTGGCGGLTCQIEVWGAQVEALPFATSYIKTEGAAVSRAADVASASVSVDSGNLTVEAQSLGQPTIDEDCIVSLTNGTTTNYVAILATDDADSARAYIVKDGALLANLFASGETFNEMNTLSLNFASDNTIAYIGSSAPVSDTSVIIPEINIMQIGRLNTVLPFYGNIKRIQVYDTALTPNEVKAL